MRKKLVLVYLVLSSAFFSCGRKADTLLEDVPESTQEKSFLRFNSEQAIWTTVYDSMSQTLSLKKRIAVNPDTLSKEKVIGILNASWPNVQLQLIETRNDTILVKIPESIVLTQQMGSTGAKEYLAIATYSLTELPGIHKVHFQFEEGDHATPGLYTRNDFTNL